MGKNANNKDRHARHRSATLVRSTAEDKALAMMLVKRLQENGMPSANMQDIFLEALHRLAEDMGYWSDGKITPEHAAEFVMTTEYVKRQNEKRNSK